MRTYLLLLLTILMVKSVYAQPNHYFQNNPVWMVEERTFASNNCAGTLRQINYSVNGDTLIGSDTYKNIFQAEQILYYDANCQVYASTVNLPAQPVFFLRSASRRIYVRFVADTTEYLLYDFNLAVGDTLPLSYAHNPNTMPGGPYVVLAVDSVNTVNGYLRRFSLQGGSATDSLYEGIGGTGGLTETVFPLILSGHHYLRCYSLNGSKVYPQQQVGSCDLQLATANIPPAFTAKILPQPCTGFAQIRLPAALEDAAFFLYSPTGECVHSETVSGSEILLRTQSLEAGVYSFRILSKTTVYTGKLIVSSN